jgi:hypothetical protein
VVTFMLPWCSAGSGKRRQRNAIRSAQERWSDYKRRRPKR